MRIRDTWISRRDSDLPGIPTGSGKMSIRASYSIFFDTPESFTARDWANASPWGNQINLTAPAGGFADPYAGYPGGNPFPFPYPPDQGCSFPAAGRVHQLSAGPAPSLHAEVESEPAAATCRKTGWPAPTYIGDKGTHYRSSIEGNPALFAPGATLANLNQRRVLYLLNPAQGAYYSAITQMDDGVNTSYNGMKLSLQHRFAQHYTLSDLVHLVALPSGCPTDRQPANRQPVSESVQPQRRSRPVRSRPAEQLRRHLHLRESEALPPLRNAVLGGGSSLSWFRTRTGFPFTPRTGVDASLSGNGQDRPNVVGSPYIKDTTSLRWIDPKAFVPNAGGTFGNAGYNSLIAPGYFNMDSSLMRTFRIPRKAARGAKVRVLQRFEPH